MSTTSMAIFSNPLFATYSVYTCNASIDNLQVASMPVHSIKQRAQRKIGVELAQITQRNKWTFSVLGITNLQKYPVAISTVCSSTSTYTSNTSTSTSKLYSSTRTKYYISVQLSPPPLPTFLAPIKSRMETFWCQLTLVVPKMTIKVRFFHR